MTTPSNRVARRSPVAAEGAADRLIEESDFLSPGATDAADSTEMAQPIVNWPQRAEAIAARPLDRGEGIARFIALWGTDSGLQHLAPSDVERMADHLDYASVAAGCDVIAQDEWGDYLLVVLDGRVAVERVQVGGARTRLGEARAGDILGEMSLLDAGARFSTCRTLVPTTLAVIDAARLDAMIRDDPRLGVALLASLSRRLSLRLRKVSARLSALLSQN